MFRFRCIFPNVLLFLSLAGLGCHAQNTPSSPATKADAPATASSSESTSSLSPELSHRVQIEIRSRYSIPPQVDIALSGLKPSAFPGYDSMTVTFTGGSHSTTHDFLLSKDHKTLAHLETYDISKDFMSQIDTKDRPVKGNPNAKVTIVNYDDFQCPFCSRMHSELFDNVFKDYGDKVKVIYKDYPLIEIHPWAMHAAIDGNCLGEQNNQAYWDFADYIHANQRLVAGKAREEAVSNLDNAAKAQAQKHQLDPQKLQACMQKQDESAVRASMSEGDKLGVDSTPTMFINGEKFSGVVPEGELRAVLDRALADNGQKAPSSAGAKQ